MQHIQEPDCDSRYCALAISCFLAVDPLVSVLNQLYKLQHYLFEAKLKSKEEPHRPGIGYV